MRLQAPRGTFDVLPDDARRRLALQRVAADVLGRAGYEPFDTPIFEDTELFARGVGAATDIVQKEMFTFEDKAGRSLTLRPEATAAICRAYVDHGMHKLAQPIKVWTWGPFFRHEAPQAGRYRQFTQLDAEALGSDDPSLDAELILLLAEFIERAGAGPARLRVSSLGSPETRAEYLQELTAYLRAREGELSEEVRERLDQNPLRAFDADHPGTRAVMEDAPRLLDRLEEEDAEHFAGVRALLDASGMDYEVDSTLVRGLDYYTRTVFEFESERLGAQAALGGGGRYDRLIEELGGPATPGVGWAAGIERILLASTAEEQAEPRVYVALVKPDRMRTAFDLARRLRDEGIRVEIEQAGRSLKGQLKQSDRIGARTTVILGDSMDVKDMDSGDQHEAASLDEAVALVRDAFTRQTAASGAPGRDAAAGDAPGRDATAGDAPA
jgi:histidyl-tRNA synthetase